MSPVLAFVEDWHDGEWCISSLHTDLDATLIESLEHGEHVLGCTEADGGCYAIAIASRYVGTRLELLIRSHECAHVLLGHASAECTSRVERRDRERLTWLAALLLLVPEAAAWRVVTGRLSFGEAADLYGVTVDVILARLALLLRLSTVGVIAQPLLDLMLGRVLAWIGQEAARVRRFVPSDPLRAWGV